MGRVLGREAAALRFVTGSNGRPMLTDHDGCDVNLSHSGPLALIALARATDEVLPRPLLPGNCVKMFVNGDAAYPAMLDAIGKAQTSITLATYIFDHDDAGQAFASALGGAVRRGVEVRVRRCTRHMISPGSNTTTSQRISVSLCMRSSNSPVR